MTLSRRELIHAAGVVAGAAALAPLAPRARAAEPANAGGKFALPPLPYAYDALEPVIDAETMKLHHDKHENSYVESLNKYLGGSAPAMLTMSAEQVCRSLDQVPESARTAVKNNAGGVYNHEFFWSVMAKPGTGGEPKGDLLAAIEASFKGGLDTLKTAMVLAGTAQFGSGWAWLLPSATGAPLKIVHTPNQDNSLMTGGPKPLLGVDVWEHAYYLKYRNLRKKYLEEWTKVINWDAVAANFAASKKA